MLKAKIPSTTFFSKCLYFFWLTGTVAELCATSSITLPSLRNLDGISFSEIIWIHFNWCYAQYKLTCLITQCQWLHKQKPCKNGTATSPPPTLKTFSFKSIIHCKKCSKKPLIEVHKLNRSNSLSNALPDVSEAYQVRKGIPYLENPIP